MEKVAEKIVVTRTKGFSRHFLGQATKGAVAALLRLTPLSPHDKHKKPLQFGVMCMHMNNGGAKESEHSDVIEKGKKISKATKKSEEGFNEIVNSFKKIINEAILPLEEAHGSSSWQIAGDWNVRPLGLSTDDLISVQRDAKHLSKLGVTKADDAFNAKLYGHFMNPRYRLKLWSKIKETGSTSVFADYSKKLNKQRCTKCKGKGYTESNSKRWFSRKKKQNTMRCMQKAG